MLPNRSGWRALLFGKFGLALLGVFVVGSFIFGGLYIHGRLSSRHQQEHTAQTTPSSSTPTTSDKKAAPNSPATPPKTDDPKKPAQSGGAAAGGSSGASSGGGTSSGGTSNSGGGTQNPPASGSCDLPAYPDETCTGYAHTGVTLHPCSSPLTQPTYDSCLFTGEVNVSAANIHVTRSKIVGPVAYRFADGGSLRGLVLTDVEIDTSNDLGGASIGNNDYTCIRCNVHGGTRGFNVGYNVTIQDSYSHGWHSQSGDHITGMGSNGGAHNVIDHNNISCDILNDPTGYACSSGLSVYGDDSPGNDDWTITNNLLNSASSYCMNIAGPPGKPYPFTNMHVTGNRFGNMGARARSLPDSQCTEYGPIATEPSSWGVNGNVWSNNTDSNGGVVDP